MVISVIAAKTAAPNTQTGPPRKDMDTPPTAARNHRPGLPILLFTPREKNSSAASIETPPMIAAKITFAAKIVMRTTRGIATTAVRTLQTGWGSPDFVNVVTSMFNCHLGGLQSAITAFPLLVGDDGFVKILSEMLFGDAAVIGCGLSTIAQETINGIDNFGAAAIIQSNIENHSAIAARFGNGLVQFGLNRNIKFVGPSDRAKSDIVLMNVFELLVQVFLQELHQRRNFAAGTLPVFD